MVPSSTKHRTGKTNERTNDIVNFPTWTMVYVSYCVGRFFFFRLPEGINGRFIFGLARVEEVPPTTPPTRPSPLPLPRPLPTPSIPMTGGGGGGGGGAWLLVEIVLPHCATGLLLPPLCCFPSSEGDEGGALKGGGKAIDMRVCFGGIGG